jgi:hypothetical protein
VFGDTEREVWEHYPDMLRAHLNAYVQNQLSVPFPVLRWDVPEVEKRGSGSVPTYSWHILTGILKVNNAA